MIRYFALLLGLGLAGPAFADGVSDWAGRLASALARPAAETLDSGNLSRALGGGLSVRVKAGRPCQPEVGLALPPDTNLVLVGSVVGFPERKACPTAAPISILNVGLKAVSAREAQAARMAMLATLPRACFDGILPTDTRRHAPPSHMTAWSDPHRLLTFVWDEYDPTIFTVTYLRRDLALPGGVEQDTYQAVRDALLRPVPPVCLDQGGH